MSREMRIEANKVLDMAMAMAWRLRESCFFYLACQMVF